MTPPRWMLLPLWLCACPDPTGAPGAAAGPAAQDDAGAADAPEAPVYAPRALRLLTRAEFDHSIADALGLPAGARFSQSLPPEERVAGFDNNHQARVVEPLLASGLLQGAEAAAAAAVADARLLSCAPQPPGEACADQLLRRIGRRLFRRPLREEEAGRYLALYRGEGLQTMLTALLQSPHFLYRSELGAPDPSDATRFRLLPYETAAQLSYLLWGTGPDEALLQAAEQGALGTQAELEAQAARLLASERAAEPLQRFVEQWLQLDRLALVPKDAATYPAFTPEVRAALREETLRLADQVLRRQGAPLPELLSAPTSRWPATLWRFYGLTPPSADAEGLAPVDLQGLGRAGLLGQGSLLAAQAAATRSSPVLRGKLVRERLLCQPLPPPPPGVNIPTPSADPAITTRQRFERHSSDPACAGCHRLMDPLGFALERFDGVGVARATEAGAAIDDRGQLLAAGDASGEVSGLAGLSARLAGSAELHRCFARQAFRYGYGLDPDPGSAALWQDVARRFQQGGLTWPALITALLRSPAFLLRR